MLANIVTTARAYIGSPFRHQGRVHNGIDCVGLIVCVARDLGVDVTDRSGYGRQPYGGELEASLDAQKSFRRIIGEDPIPGDILVMGFSGPPQHVAILTDVGTIIHAWEPVGKVTEHTYSGSWKSRVRRVYRYIG